MLLSYPDALYLLNDLIEFYVLYIDSWLRFSAKQRDSVTEWQVKKFDLKICFVVLKLYVES